MILNKQNNLSGEVYAQVRNYKSGTVKRTYGKAPNAQALKARFTRRSESLIERPIRNLITDTGLNMLGTSSWDNVYIHLGTGTEPFIESDTQLKNPYIPSGIPITSLTNTKSAITASRHRFRSTFSATYTAGIATGIFTELGVNKYGSSNPSSSSYFLNHPMLALAQIKDNNGDPTSIQVASDEELIISHSVDNYVEPKTNPTQLFEWKGEQIPTVISIYDHTSDNWFINIHLYPKYSFDFYYSTSSSPSQGLRSAGFVLLPYISGSFERNFYVSIPLDTVNRNIYGFRSNAGSWDMRWEDNLPRVKLASEILTIGDADNPAFKITWGRAA